MLKEEESPRTFNENINSTHMTTSRHTHSVCALLDQYHLMPHQMDISLRMWEEDSLEPLQYCLSYRILFSTEVSGKVPKHCFAVFNFD